MGVVGRTPALGALLAARGVSVVGDAAGTVALVIHVQRERGSGTAVALLFLAQALPRLLSPLTGTLADRRDQRRLMAGCELLQGW